jgi:tetratricopeptide (TPR) repeat protein
MMRRFLIGLLLVPVLVAGEAISLRAQSAAPANDRDSNSYHYVPPPASKSVEIGDFYLRRKDYRGAISRYQEAITTDPDYAPAYHQLGKVYDKLGRKREALAMYRKYLKALPSEKQAEEANDVRKAIGRLERELHEAGNAQTKARK